MFMKELAQSRMSTFGMFKDKVLFGEIVSLLKTPFVDMLAWVLGVGEGWFAEILCNRYFHLISSYKQRRLVLSL